MHQDSPSLLTKNGKEKIVTGYWKHIKPNRELKKPQTNKNHHCHPSPVIAKILFSLFWRHGHLSPFCVPHPWSSPLSIHVCYKLTINSNSKPANFLLAVLWMPVPFSKLIHPTHISRAGGRQEKIKVWIVISMLFVALFPKIQLIRNPHLFLCCFILHSELAAIHDNTVTY